MEVSTATVPPRRTGRRWWPVVKWTLFSILLYFVVKRAWAIWQSSPPTTIQIQFGWLILAGLLYLVAWIPSIWFWRALLNRLDQHPGHYPSIRAYYVGHVGKYVPGKALVLVIRAALLKPFGINPILAALTAAYETLVAMACGAAIGIALAPASIPDGVWIHLPQGLQFLRRQTLLVPLVVAVLTIATTPFSARLFTRVGRKVIPPADDEVRSTGITAGLMIQGLFVSSVGWAIMALSLGCTLQALSDTSIDLSQFPVWLAAVCLSGFIGFVILVAPGGIGVREWVLIEILKDQPTIGPDKAVLAAGLLRLIWFAAELVVAGPLYAFPPASGRKSGDA